MKSAEDRDCGRRYALSTKTFLYVNLFIIYKTFRKIILSEHLYMIPVRGSLPPPPPPTLYGPKTCVLQHSAWKRCICSVFCMVGCWCGPQPCKFVGFLQPTFRKRVICNVSASTSWSSAAAPSSISVSNYHIILNLLLTVFSLGTGLISVYILCLSNFLLECLVFRNWSNLKFS